MILLRPVLTAALLGVVSIVCAAPAPASVHTLAQAPADLRAAVTRTLAAKAATDPAYAIGTNGCARVPAPGQHASLTGCFARRGAEFHDGAEHLGLRLTAFGHAGHLHPVSLTRTVPHANRIVYRAPGLREWWRVLPMGYEQGFTLNRAPAGHGKIVLQLTASAAPRNHHGTLSWGQLRYGKLTVIDAEGHVLPASLTTHGRIITLTFDARNARLPVTVDPLVWTQQEITASDGAGGLEFGYSVALSVDGSTALVGAPAVNNLGRQGAAYVYTYSAATGTWTQVAELTASNGSGNDYFGWSVALSSNGAMALVGAIGINSSQGAAYIYTRPASGIWTSTSTYTAELTASNGAANNFFGVSVALSSNGTTALIGAQGTNSYQGAAYVYTEPTSGTWANTSTYAAEFTASNGAANNFFGFSVALSSNGTTALIGADGANSNQGAAYVYTEPTSGWATTSTYAAELTASNGVANDYFGHSVALSSNGATALIGAAHVNNQGAAYVYTEPTSGWVSATETAELTASNGAANDHFGNSVALASSGATALIGAVGVNSLQGAAYVYTEPTSGTWANTSTYAVELTASNGAANNFFGYSVALSSDGTTGLIGAYVVNSGSGQGAAYILPSADLSTVLNAPATVTTSTAYTVDYLVTNDGSVPSADLKVQLPVPSGATYDSISSTPQGTCSYNSTTQVATCDLGPLAGGGTMDTAQLKLTPTVTSGTITQTASVEGSPNLSQGATSSLPGGGGGGGAIGPWALLALGCLGFVRRRCHV
ncbi:MAG TPA: GlyGly-CTERM sorting domain-containing protein [Gammaproteobacteria bacterium]|nr:GlyGly-CTERM sorting domain-containing protein [Gammaproteobacteria bacterium]